LVVLHESSILAQVIHILVAESVEILHKEGSSALSSHLIIRHMDHWVVASGTLLLESGAVLECRGFLMLEPTLRGQVWRGYYPLPDLLLYQSVKLQLGHFLLPSSGRVSLDPLMLHDDAYFIAERIHTWDLLNEVAHLSLGCDQLLLLVGGT